MADNTYIGKITVCLIFAVLFSGFIGGCANKKIEKSNSFFEKWRAMAEKSKGHSPSAMPKTIKLPKEAEQKVEQKAKIAAQRRKRLPTQKVSLKMHEAPAGVVLRTLARAAKQNILINAGVQGSISTNIKNAPWDQSFLGILRTQRLTYAWEGDILRVMTLQDMEHDLKMQEIEEKQEAQKLGSKLVEPLLTRVINIDYADVNKLRDNLKEFLTKNDRGKSRGSVMVDKHTNALIVQAIRDDIAKMIPLIEKLDKPTCQILIKANIVETNRSTAKELGIQWGGMYGNKHGDYNYFVTPGGSEAIGAGGQGFGVNFPANISNKGASLGLMYGVLGGNILDLQLSALQEEGKLNILSVPSITTLDNQTAFTENGEKVPFVTMDENGERTVEFEDAVLRLEITPHVIDGKNLKMHIIVKKDEVDTSRTVFDNPFIIKKQTETTLIVQDGETIVISGLTKTRKIASDSGVPGLKDVPILGYLFRGKAKEDTMEEVLIFITPHILKKQMMSDASQNIEIGGDVKQ